MVTSNQMVKHERRYVGHTSGWQEPMDTCVCGQKWPCTGEQPSSNSRLAALRARFDERNNPARPIQTEWRTSHTEELMNIAERLSQDLARTESARVAILAENTHYKQRVSDLVKMCANLSNSMEKMARAADEPSVEPAAYRLDYTAGKVEAFHLTTPGLLQLDIQGLCEDGRENIRATPLYRHAEPPKSDQCEVCDKPLPHVGAWSMPSCPDCQDLLEGLGQLMGDFADREQTIKADWIGRAINLICARALQPPPAVLDLPEPHYNRADNIMEMSSEDWANVRIVFGHLRQRLQRASQPPNDELRTAALEAAEFLRRYCAESSGRDLIINALERNAQTKEPPHDESQCWEPCGELGKSAEHVRIAPENCTCGTPVGRPHDVTCPEREPSDEKPAALCPRPFNGRPDGYTAADCIAAGECGCDARTAGETSETQKVTHDGN